MKQVLEGIWGVFVFVVVLAYLALRIAVIFAPKQPPQLPPPRPSTPLYAPTRPVPQFPRAFEPLPELPTTWRAERERLREDRLRQMLRDAIPEPVEVAPMPREVPERSGKDEG
jgi:hypothetical protein